MFSNFDYIYNPYIIVRLGETIQDDDDFDYFLNKWSELHLRKKKYILIFDTTEVGMVNMKYAIKMTSFIKGLKRQENQYLKGSVIIVKNKYIKFLLKFIFFMQRPVADVHLTDSDDKDFLNKLVAEINIGIEKPYNNVSIVRA